MRIIHLTKRMFFRPKIGILFCLDVSLEHRRNQMPYSKIQNVIFSPCTYIEIISYDKTKCPERIILNDRMEEKYHHILYSVCPLIISEFFSLNSFIFFTHSLDLHLGRVNAHCTPYTNFLQPYHPKETKAHKSSFPSFCNLLAKFII